MFSFIFFLYQRISMKVVNLHKEYYEVYIGRAGKGQDGYFGNPVRIGYKCPVCSSVHSSGGDTLPCYEKYLRDRLFHDETFRLSVKNLLGKVLGCFCKPKPCHGDILIKVCKELNNVSNC